MSAEGPRRRAPEAQLRGRALLEAANRCANPPLSTTERRALDAILSYTALYNRCADRVSLTQLGHVAGLSTRRLRPALRALAYRGLIDFWPAREASPDEHPYGTRVGLRPVDDVGTTSGPISRLVLRQVLELDRGNRTDQQGAASGPDGPSNRTSSDGEADQQWSDTERTTRGFPPRNLPDRLTTVSRPTSQQNGDVGADEQSKRDRHDEYFHTRYEANR
jgi:hypothetical protein